MGEAKTGDIWNWRSRDARLFMACGALVAIALLVIIPWRIFENGYLTYVSGAWAALADDVSHGVLYRPLDSELGYGGTRYFPLHFVLHGALHSLGFSLITAGHIISVLSAAAIALGGAIGLRRMGVPWTIAVATGLLALASRTAFVGMAGIRGDIFPVALGVLGLAFLPRSRNESIIPATILFTLAVLAKPTLAWAPAAAFLSMMWTLRIRESLLLCVGVGLGIAVGIAATYIWSGGEFLVSFRALATAGGLAAKNIAALGFMRPGEMAWIAGGVLVAIACGWRSLSQPFAAALPVCLLATLVLYLSPGLHINHYIDLVVIATLRLGLGIWELWPRRWPRVVLAVASVLGVMEAVALDGMVIRRGDFNSVVQALPAGKDPILSETPWVPLLAGERPFLLDAYSLAQIRRTSPEIHPKLISQIDTCKFRVVVLNGVAENGEDWYRTEALGTPFREHLIASYSLQQIVGGHAIYLPNCDRSAAPVDQALVRSDQDTVLRRGEQPNKLKVLIYRMLGKGQ